MERINEVARFYDLLVRLERRCGGRRRLAECHGRMGWPRRGVYFFIEPGEHRGDSGVGDRVVRVGTHALTERSGTSLWQRLSQHRGSARHGGGNHRGSIFRLLAGSAIKARDGTDKPRSWGIESGAGKAALRLGTDRETVRQEETGLERAVSRYLGAMPFLWLSIDDPPGPDSDRGDVERNVIALLSNFRKEPVDSPSESWVGHHSDRERVCRSGLWNNNHVEDAYDPGFLERFASLIDSHKPQ